MTIDRLRRRRVLVAWVVLVAASFMVQRFVVFRTPPLPRAGAIRVEVPVFDSAGPVPETMPIGVEVVQHGDPGAEVVFVCLHGSPTAGGDFGRLAAKLAEDYARAGAGPIRVIEVVQPGYGASDRRAPDHGIEAAARTTFAVMDALDIERAHLVGHSLGGGTILHAADQAPERVASLVSYGGIGLQEHEGTGDHALEHLKYRLGWWVLVAGPELLPHFGLLGEPGFRRALIRNFTDTDQRRLRPILESLDDRGVPLLLLHGREDPLVPARAARAHHDLVGTSELVMFDRSHFMIFDDEGAAMLAREIGDFARRMDAGRPPTRRTIDPHRAEDETPASAFEAAIRPDRGPWIQFGAIVLATQFLEDPTTIAVGLLVRRGMIDPFLGVVALVVGIVIGDLLLYLMGRLGHATILRSRRARSRLPVETIDRFARWFERSGWWAILASRLMPGARVPMYVAIGASGAGVIRFLAWVLLAVVIWVPLVVAATAIFGPSFVAGFESVLGEGWPAILGAVVALLLLLRLAGALVTREGRRRLITSARRSVHWEFWPVWAAYGPLVPWWLWKAVRVGYRTVSAVNPCWPDGGTIGESKHLVMALVDPEHRPAMVRVPLGDDGRIEVDTAIASIEAAGISTPMVVKPDRGERGAGVRFCDDEAMLRRALASATDAQLVQARAVGDREIGVFWYRDPATGEGHLFSITDKVFPSLEGDGATSLRDLVWRHPRYRLQYPVFERRFGESFDRVPRSGERVSLGRAGNHSQGTMFRDGEHLRTPELEAAVDAICGGIEGFHFGRLDLRCADDDAVRRGVGLEVIEVNGLSSESTNMYDPEMAMTRRWSIILAQWRLAIRIGRANRERGTAGLGWADLVRGILASRRRRIVGTSISD